MTSYYQVSDIVLWYIAYFYVQVEDYDNARRYLAPYLQEKDSSPVAHKLSGQISEKLNQPDKVRNRKL